MSRPHRERCTSSAAEDQDERAADLASRWQRARLAALRAVVGPAAHGTEDELLACALDVDAPQLMRRVFDHSAVLGAGYRRHFGEPHGVASLPQLLGRLRVRCLTGRWLPARGVARLERAPCAASSSAGACDYWREAVDGLVAGLSSDARHARHQSLGHGDARCVDVLYDDPEDDARYGPLEPELVEAVRPVGRLVQRFHAGLTLTLLGVSEGVLLYRLSGRQGAAPAAARAIVESALARRLPHLALRELSPRPVQDEPHLEETSP